MARAFTPKVITANDLLEGDVIYFTAQDTWTRDLSEAELITDEADAQLRLIEAEKQNIKIVGAYLADAKAGPNGPEPTHFREEFRRTGPSNYFHGKQEAEANV
ncbi:MULTISPECIES: DUF2849 domain-containing protein [unclassified Leisingera]|uniref:DUF2849 domain-containing protein n=1 Tax=unclassified Leisingera TaxID=2614906 RepID=UPI00030B3549|nr:MULTISPECIES: DUF2849 domain-containing protein [unclassified Leisingera]KIC19061.1 sulfite reductase [Leisingera sp. ANG-DT]KIC26410.1 sulfite reductase [Leisingera sp. ANG-S3]KIC29879.1 sulfite reductase [Leisingera sp. ANG-M6]KIC33409.1 sulfite reductase [Leisingera sp. ANG-S5]KIC52729.1 sulfite reductase [Leisingera sp. ANG-S]